MLTETESEHLENEESPARALYPALGEKYGQGVHGSLVFDDLRGDYLAAVLPGSGSPGEGCGDPKPLFCKKCGNSFWGKSSCMERLCPECYEKWARKEGRAMATRIFTGSHHLYGRKARKVHAVVSFRVDGQERLKELRARAYKVCKVHGIAGGAEIFHPFRKDEDDRFVPDGTVHFHIIGVAPGDIAPGSESEAADGIVFKHILDAKHNDFRGLRRMRDCVRLAQYLLTHCGIVEDRHSVTWFGCLAYNQLSTGLLEKEYPEAYEELNKVRGSRCPICGSWDTEPCEIYDGTGWPVVVVPMHPWPDYSPGDADGLRVIIENREGAELRAHAADSAIMRNARERMPLQSVLSVLEHHGQELVVARIESLQRDKKVAVRDGRLLPYDHMDHPARGGGD